MITSIIAELNSNNNKKMLKGNYAVPVIGIKKKIHLPKKVALVMGGFMYAQKADRDRGCSTACNLGSRQRTGKHNKPKSPG